MQARQSFVQRLMFNLLKLLGSVFETLILFVKPNTNNAKYLCAL